jgi:DNA replication protein DnaC
VSRHRRHPITVGAGSRFSDRGGDLILIDEIGFAPMDNTGAQLFFRLVAAAYERRSLGVASHWPFEEWGRFLPDQSTAVSLLDRLLHQNVLVVTEGESFRMKEARKERKT